MVTPYCPLLINQISDFLRDHKTIIKINDFILESSSIFIGILQGFLLSLILYLFYGADLLDLCDDIKLYISDIGFIDNANILIYSFSIQKNYRKLEYLYSVYIEQSKHHSSIFDPKKFYLIYFLRTPRKFDIIFSLKISNIELQSSIDIRVLGIILDPALYQNAQIRAVEAKIVN